MLRDELRVSRRPESEPSDTQQPLRCAREYRRRTTLGRDPARRQRQGNLTEEGGGGGFNCNPQGVFAVFQSPVYSDYEDSTIHGGISIKNLTSCWLGVARVHVHGNASFVNDQLADPDGAELLSNDFDGNLACSDNSMMWDSVGSVREPLSARSRAQPGSRDAFWAVCAREPPQAGRRARDPASSV